MVNDAEPRPELAEEEMTPVPVEVNVPRELYQNYIDWAWRENRRPSEGRIERGPATPAERLIDHIDFQPRYFVEGEMVEAYSQPEEPSCRRR